jgi:hypothetical protein
MGSGEGGDAAARVGRSLTKEQTTMQFTRPQVTVPGDKADAMAAHGWLMGFTPSSNRCLWRFGFDEGSSDAKSFGVSLPGPKLYVLASRFGHVVKTHRAATVEDLPAGMREPLSELA